MAHLLDHPLDKILVKKTKRSVPDNRKMLMTEKSGLSIAGLFFNQTTRLILQ